MRTAIFTACIVGFLAAPAFAQAPPTDPKPVTIPFTLLPSRHIVLDVKVNGKGPYKLIFDTGAPLNLIDSKVGKEAGLTKKSGGFGIFSGGLNQVEVESLTVGGVEAKKLPAVVMDHPTVTALSNAFEDEVGKIHGIVGFPFFGRYATTIDYQKKELVLKPTNYVPGDYLGDLVKNMTASGDRGGKPKVIGAAGLWGFAVSKADDDLPGVFVTQVFADTPAATGGVKVGDRVLTIDGRWTDTVPDAYLATSLVKPGRTAIVVVSRDGKELSLKVTPRKGY